MKNVKLDLSLNISVFKQRQNEKKKTITQWILLKIQVTQNSQRHNGAV